MRKKVDLLFINSDESGDLRKGIFSFGWCVRHSNGAHFNAYQAGALFTGIAHPKTGTLDEFVAFGLLQVRLDHLFYQRFE
jgi:hypothetical protein